MLDLLVEALLSIFELLCVIVSDKKNFLNEEWRYNFGHYCTSNKLIQNAKNLDLSTLAKQIGFLMVLAR